MVSSVSKRGYADTSVAHVIELAGVSRKTFYELFDDKEDCFFLAYDAMSERFAKALATVERSGSSAQHHASEQIRVYLTVLALDVTMARAFIVEVQAAGPRSVARRARVNRLFADLVFGWAVKDQLLRRAIIGGINDVVADALTEGTDPMALLGPLVEFVTRVIDPLIQK